MGVSERWHVTRREAQVRCVAVSPLVMLTQTRVGLGGRSTAARAKAIMCRFRGLAQSQSPDAETCIRSFGGANERREISRGP